MKKILVTFALLSPSLAFADSERYPDDFWVTVEGRVSEGDGHSRERYWTRQCDLEGAKKAALQMCLNDGAEDCQVVKVYQHWCRTKCNCDSW